MSSYPLATPTTDGETITVDMMLNEPTRITAYLSEIGLKNYFADKIFSTRTGVTGGAIVYSQVTENDVYANRDVQVVDAGAEFPVVTFGENSTKVAAVEKFGGKFFITDEARSRNDQSNFPNDLRKLSNTINRGVHRRSISALEASIAAVGASAVIGSVGWASAAALTGASRSAAALPAATLAMISGQAEERELGYSPNLLIVNPQESTNFQLTYGSDWKSVLENWGYEMISSNLVTPGEGYALTKGQVGVMGLEKALTTETWRETGTQRNWVQSDVWPVFAVTDPHAVYKITGLGA